MQVSEAQYEEMAKGIDQPARKMPIQPLVAVLTGGADKPYSLGLATALAKESVPLDFIGSNEIDGPELHQSPFIRFLNLRGEQSVNASAVRKLLRVSVYYLKLIRYALRSKARVFHILWNNKFEYLDRTLLMLYYRLLGKSVVFTAHNVNTAKRDNKDSWLNRLTLKTQYRLADHIFVHTEKMRAELLAEYGVPADKATVIPFGINNTLRDSDLNKNASRKVLGLSCDAKVVLFFGNIAPYKGLEYLVDGFSRIAREDRSLRLLIVGRPKACAGYWAQIQSQIACSGVDAQIIQRIEFVPDDDVEVFCKAADVLVLPYTEIFQSGVLFVGYTFGLPVLASDVGSLREDIIEGKTGLVFPPKDPAALGEVLRKYFTSEMFKQVEERRPVIRAYAGERYSWTKVSMVTKSLYESLVEKAYSRNPR
jgi:D-inositol-3-phosphate glycosyltransferase